MIWNEFGLGLFQGSSALCCVRHPEKLAAPHPLQLESQNCCSMLANFGYNLPTGEVEISLLVFPCFLFPREQFFSFCYKNREKENWPVFRDAECLEHHLESVLPAKQFNITENLPFFRHTHTTPPHPHPPFRTVLHVNTAQKLLSDEDPVGIQINYIFNCLPMGMDCIFLQREARWFLLQMNQNLEAGHALHFHDSSGGSEGSW